MGILIFTSFFAILINMIKDKYLKQLSERIKKQSKGKYAKFFIFGSSLRKKHFGDIDIGFMGDLKDKDIREVKESFEDSTFPYFVEFINFNKVSKSFKENVFNNKVLWIKR